jgi:hypothetical protein
MVMMMKGDEQMQIGEEQGEQRSDKTTSTNAKQEEQGWGRSEWSGLGVGNQRAPPQTNDHAWRGAIVRNDR